VLLVLFLPEGAGVVAAAERSQHCRKQLALGQPPKSRNRFQSFASFLFLALLKLLSKKKTKILAACHRWATAGGPTLLPAT
jgi:hypothetical protein